MIEKAKLNDLEEVYELICILEQKQLNKAHFDKVFQEGIQNEDVEYLVYRKDEKILGFLSFSIHHYLHHDNDTGEIVELVVMPEHRGLRIGEKLLQAIEDIARERKLEQIELSTSTYRKKPITSMKSMGISKIIIIIQRILNSLIMNLVTISI